MDQYHFYDEIGKGRHSQVYKGRQKKTVEYVAIKRVDKALMDRVVNEVQVMHRLNSPHTLRFHNWYETRNNLWLILEYCTGGDMLSLLNQDGRLPEAAVKVFGVDLMTGLQYLHSHGYLFCDLKPSNVLVDEYGVVKLSDFGLSRRIPSPNTPNTATPRKKGTPYYMAPELFLEEGVHSYKSELWSLGCMLFELYVGRPPWTSTSLNELIRSILHDPFTFPPELKVSKEFRDLLSCLLAKDPLKRASWAEALAHDFWSVMLPPKSVPLPSEQLYDSMLDTMRAQLPLSDELGEGSLTSLNDSTLEESSDTRGSSVLDESTLISTNASISLKSNPNPSFQMPPPSPLQHISNPPPHPSPPHPLSQPKQHSMGGSGGGGDIGRAAIVRMSAGARLNHGGGEDVTLSDRDTEVDFERVDRVLPPHSSGRESSLTPQRRQDKDYKLEHHHHQAAGAEQYSHMGGRNQAAGSSMASEGGFGGSDVSEDSEDISPTEQPITSSYRSDSKQEPGPLDLSVRSSHHGSLTEPMHTSMRQYEEEKKTKDNLIGGSIDGKTCNQMIRNEANLSKLKSKNRIPNQPPSQPKQTVEQRETQVKDENEDQHNLMQATPEPLSTPNRATTKHDIAYQTPPKKASNESIDKDSNKEENYRPVSEKKEKGKQESEKKNDDQEDDEDEYWAWEEEVSRSVPVSQLVASGPGDLSVRPIVLNKFIEVVEAPDFDVTCLPFQAYSTQQILEMPSSELEDYLTSVYKSLATKDIPVADKVHVLSYLYRISTIDAVANIVINSSFAPLLLKMAKKFKSSNLRALVVTLLGLLVRHATLVVPDQADSVVEEDSNNDVGGLMRVMLDLLKETNVRLRRRAMATLGELLFYVHTLDPSDPHAPLVGNTTQPNQANQNVRWYVPGAAVPSVARCLQEGEDEIVCHYACKTVENILAQASPAQCRRFASLEIGVRLTDLALHSQRRSSALHSTAASALAHFLRRVLLPDDLIQHSNSHPPHSNESAISSAYGHSFSSPPPPSSNSNSNRSNNLDEQQRSVSLTPLQNVVDQSPSQPNSLSPAPPNSVAPSSASSSATVAAGQPGAGGAAGPRLVSRIFEKTGTGAMQAIAEGVLEPSSARIQVAFVTMVVTLFWESGDGDHDHTALLSNGVWPLQSPRSPHTPQYQHGSSGNSSSTGGNAAATLAGRPLRQIRQQLLGSNSKLLAALVKCVERGLSSSARAKAMVALRVVCARHPPALVQVLDRGLLLKLEKLVSSPSTLEADPYLRSCSLQLFIFLVTQAVDNTNFLTEECYQLALNASPNASACFFAAPFSDRDENHNQIQQPLSHVNNSQRLNWYLSSFSSVSHLIAAQCVNETLVTAPMLLENIVRLLEFTCDSSLSNHMTLVSTSSPMRSFSCRYHDPNAPSQNNTKNPNITSTEKRRIDGAFTTAIGNNNAASSSGSGGGITSRNDLQQILLLTLQGLCKNTEILLPQRIPFIATKLVPSLCRVLIETNSDARANTITLLRLLLPPLLLVEHNQRQQLLLNTQQQQQQQSYDLNHFYHVLKPAAVLSASVECFVLPFLPLLISDMEPIPQFALSLCMELSQTWKNNLLNLRNVRSGSCDVVPYSLSFGDAMKSSNKKNQKCMIEEIVDVAHRSPSPQVLGMARQLAEVVEN